MMHGLGFEPHFPQVVEWPCTEGRVPFLENHTIWMLENSNLEQTSGIFQS